MSGRTHPVVPSDGDAALARKARAALAGSGVLDQALSIRIAADSRRISFDLPPLVLRLLIEILEETAAGNAVSLVPIETEVTTHQAAALLNVSRPYLIGLVDKGALPARLVGKHRRLPLREVLAYKAEDFAKRSAGLDELVAHDQKLGLYE